MVVNGIAAIRDYQAMNIFEHTERGFVFPVLFGV